MRLRSVSLTNLGVELFNTDLVKGKTTTTVVIASKNTFVFLYESLEIIFG